MNGFRDDHQTAPGHSCRSGFHDCIFHSFSSARNCPTSATEAPSIRRQPIHGSTWKSRPPGRQSGQPSARHRGHPLVMEDIRGISPGTRLSRVPSATAPDLAGLHLLPHNFTRVLPPQIQGAKPGLSFLLKHTPKPSWPPADHGRPGCV